MKEVRFVEEIFSLCFLNLTNLEKDSKEALDVSTFMLTHGFDRPGSVLDDPIEDFVGPIIFPALELVPDKNVGILATRHKFLRKIIADVI